MALFYAMQRYAANLYSSAETKQRPPCTHSICARACLIFKLLGSVLYCVLTEAGSHDDDEDDDDVDDSLLSRRQIAQTLPPFPGSCKRSTRHMHAKAERTSRQRRVAQVPESS